MNLTKDITIIIPHKDSVVYLTQLFSTLPISDRVEIILVDNSIQPIKREDINTDKEFVLLYSDPIRGAGGARNVGIENAHGTWLVFADADDYFTNDAFETFNQYKDCDADLIYFCMNGIYMDTGEYSTRGEPYTNLVRRYINGEINEEQIRLNFSSPCSKMVRTDLVRKYRIKFDEVLASNDVFFSTLVGYYAHKILAVDKVTYIATVTKGSLTKRKDYSVISSRFQVYLRRNKFLRMHGLGKYQSSVMYLIYELLSLKKIYIIYVIYNIIKYKQNPFVGMNNWLKSYKKYLNKRNLEKKYIVK